MHCSLSCVSTVHENSPRPLSNWHEFPRILCKSSSALHIHLSQNSTDLLCHVSLDMLTLTQGEKKKQSQSVLMKPTSLLKVRFPLKQPFRPNLLVDILHINAGHYHPNGPTGSVFHCSHYVTDERALKVCFSLFSDI